MSNSPTYGPVMLARDVNVQLLENKSTTRPTRVTIVLMTRHRFRALFEGTHNGAFGQDYGIVTADGAHPDVFGLLPVLFVYKFPWDMFGPSEAYLPTECSIDVPLPVGTYYLRPDKWFMSAQKAHQNYALAVDNAVQHKYRTTTKMRTTLENGEVFSILRDGTYFPMANNVRWALGNTIETGPTENDHGCRGMFPTFSVACLSSVGTTPRKYGFSLLSRD